MQVGRDAQYRHRWDALARGGRQVGWASQDLWSCPQQGIWTGHTCPGSQERQPDLRTFRIATTENWLLFFLLSVVLIIFLKSRHKLNNFKINPTNLQNWHRSSSWSVTTLDSKFPRTSSSLPAAHTSSPSRMVSLSHLSNGPCMAEEGTEPVGLAWLLGQWGSGQASSPNLRDSCCFRKFDPRGTKRQIAQILAQGNNTGSQWKNQGTRGRLNSRKKTAVAQCGAYSEGRTGDTVEQSPLAETQPQSPARGSQSIKIGWLFN